MKKIKAFDSTLDAAAERIILKIGQKKLSKLKANRKKKRGEKNIKYMDHTKQSNLLNRDVIKKRKNIKDNIFEDIIVLFSKIT